MINERYFLIDGQHRLMVAKKLGLKYIDAIVANEKRLNES
jgi:ParB-like chromosome segregation protein Spo0J